MNEELERLLILKGLDRLPSVLIAASECAPLSKTGGLADVVGALPKALAAQGFDARVITPYHRCIKEKYADKVRHLAYFYVDLGWRHQYAGLEVLELPGLTAYLIDSEYYYGDKIYRGGEAEVEQYAFFQRAVMEAIPMLPDFSPEVLHCNDWQTAMLPFLIKTQYSGRPQGALRTVLTIHNIAFQGWLSFESACDLLGIDPRWCAIDGVAHYGCANFLKTGILFADRVNTVSPSYADEIRTPAFGEGLQDVLLLRGADVSGILNGLDTETYDPATDPNISVHYSAACPEKKLENKRALIRELGLTKVTDDTPIVAMVTRMTAQKGFELVLQGMETMMEQDMAFVLLGTGDQRYEDAMRYYAARYPGRLAACMHYDEALSRRIYAGADFLLMPSGFEPCGLSQMIAMRYGTVPIVHETGGLRDTVQPYNRFTGEGNGFSFYDFNCGTMLGCVAYALATYRDRPAMAGLIRSGIEGDYAFDRSATAYGLLYVSVLPGSGGGMCHDVALEYYRSPFGAVQCGETVRLRLKVTGLADTASLVVNGEESPMAREPDGAFTATLTAPDTPGLLLYWFRLPFGLAFGANGLVSGEAQGWPITVYAPDFAAPAWAEGAVVYQIFPDRYAPGGGAFAKGVRYHRALGRTVEVHRHWDEPVKWQAGPGPFYEPNDFYGGTLRGITERLPELKVQGVDALLLSPIFESGSNHRYDTADYRKIDPMLGTEAAFRQLCSKAKALGIRVVIDGVFSHTSDDSVYFNKYGRYPEPGAYQDERSPYYPWYDFTDFPDGYRCWSGYSTLPEVKETNRSWQKFMVSGEDAVMRHWLEAGAGGWRLDVTDELPDEVIGLMRRSVKETDPEALLLGDVWADATTRFSFGARRSYALGTALDSVMNYPFRAAMLDFALGHSGAAAFRDFLCAQRLAYPAPMYRCLLNLLGSHDTARIRSVLGSGSDGSELPWEKQASFTLTEAQDARGRALQVLCAAVQFALPGMPAVYYGDEEGMQGLRDPFCRAPYRRQDGALRAWYATLAKTRAESPVLRHGDAAFAAAGDDVLLILRFGPEGAKLLAFNRSDAPVTVQPDKADFRPLRAADAARLGALRKLTVPALGWKTVEVKCK